MGQDARIWNMNGYIDTEILLATEQGMKMGYATFFNLKMIQKICAFLCYLIMENTIMYMESQS